MVRIAIVGIGFMGMIHYLAARQLRGGRVVAICSRDPRKRAGDWRSLRGNFGPPGDITDLSHVKTYERLEDMLADGAVDLVDVCLPTDQHATAAVAALRAGKHVLVEKPIALGLREADAMIHDARQAGRMLLVAHVLPFFAEFAYALRLVRENRYGRVLAGHFKRIISAPDWSGDAGTETGTGGPLVDLHIHDTHFVALAWGLPRQVMATGNVVAGSIRHLETLYLYGRGLPCLACSTGALCQKGRPFAHGFELWFEKATLSFESGARPLILLTADGKVRRPRLPATDPVSVFRAELQAAVDGIRTGQEPTALSAALAREALALCYREGESLRAGRPALLRARAQGRRPTN